MGQTSNPFEVLIGEMLSAVTFVMDYWQLQFDGPTINALSRLEVFSEGTTLRDGHDQFRNVICSQIGKAVTAVKLVQLEALTITFSDGSWIKIALRLADHRGPELIIFYGEDLSPMIVVQQGD